MDILLAASEGTPFIKSGGLADVVGSLSKAICEQGHNCAVVLPLYEAVSKEAREKMKFVDSFNVPLGWRNQYCGLFELEENGVNYYFLDNENYFKRKNLYGYFDDGERFAYYSKAILEMLRYIKFSPKVIHCNDWQTGLVPVFLNAFYRQISKFKKIKTVFTIHNIQYQGKYSLDISTDVLGLYPEDIAKVEYDDCTNYMKGGLQEADMITTVSPEYAKEILDPWFSHGLDTFLIKNQFKLTGILNGLSYDDFNPKTDKQIYKNYHDKYLTGKKVCKQMLQKELGLDVNEDSMIIAMVTRLVDHKGLDLVEQAFCHLMNWNVQFVLLGSGDESFENFFINMEAKYPGKVSTTIGFNEGFSHKVYSGADIFLMPSKSEPCGLSQLIALRYGTIPIVRLTGGLKDTVHDFGENTEDANGYTFYDYNPDSMLDAIYRAYDTFQNKALWRQQIKKALECDYSWGSSSEKYINLYKNLLK